MSAARDQTHSSTRRTGTDQLPPWERVWAGTDPAARARAARHLLLRGLCRGAWINVLDVGCGSGEDLLALAPYVAVGVGVDFEAASVAAARDAASGCGAVNISFAVGDAVVFHPEGPVPEQFDLILIRCGEVHGGDPRRELLAARRRLARGGRIVLLAPHAKSPARLWRRWLGRAEDMLPGISNQVPLTPAEARRLAERAGLEPTAFHIIPWAGSGREDPAPAFIRILVDALAHLPFAALRGGFALVMRAKV